MVIFDPDDPLVLSGEFDVEGYRPRERARIEKARQRRASAQAVGAVDPSEVSHTGNPPTRDKKSS